MPDAFVLDCSVAAKWVFPEPDRPIAMDWLKRHNSGQVQFIAPDLILVEFASLIAKRSRQRTMSAAEARTAYAFMTKSVPPIFDTRPLLESALELSLAHHLSLWACVYLALALEHTCPLLTADRRLFRAGKGRHPSIRLL